MASADTIEASRLRKIQENKEKLLALGVKDAAREALEVGEKAKQNKQPAKRKRAPPTPVFLEKRASQRTKDVVINYNEDQNDHLLRGLPRRGSGNGSRSCYTGPRELDDDDAYHARLEAGIMLNSQSLDSSPSKSGLTSVPSSSAKRGPQDSGKGVRVMGGKVYDSKYGVTCHWCRQKTLCESVTCTAPTCGHRRMPVSFCKSCLMNRHGEDWKVARDSGCWVCPPCRGSCGPGCTLCCNCGPCRKKAGLAPTGQVKSLAIQAGFDNVHDWLVHNETGESAAALVLRKWEAPWAAWLNGGSNENKEDTGLAKEEKQVPAEETDAADDDEPPRNAARPQKGASRASNAGVGESKKKPSGKDALATPDGNVVCAQGPRASTGILAVSPPEDEAIPGKRVALEPRRLDFNDSAESEDNCILFPQGTAPGANEKGTVGDCHNDLKKAPKRPTRATRRARA